MYPLGPRNSGPNSIDPAWANVQFGAFLFLLLFAISTFVGECNDTKYSKSYLNTISSGDDY